MPRRVARLLALIVVAGSVTLNSIVALPVDRIISSAMQLLVVSTMADLMLGVKTRNRSLAEEQQELAERDALTGLVNRRGAHRLLDSLAPGSGLVLVDLDHFKAINDEHGHLAGDEVLRSVGQVLRRSIRRDDVAIRWGGEGFLVVVPVGAHDRADDPVATEPTLMAERVRTAIEADETVVTASVGAARLLPGERWEAALDRADEALYLAKQRGRNRSEIAVVQ